MPLPITIYQRPNGKRIEAVMQKVTDEDAAWYKEHNIKVGMEQITETQIAIYAEYGETDGEPDEITYVVPKGETCEEAMSKIRTKIEKIWS